MTAAPEHDDLAHAAKDAEIEALQRTVQRLCGALDALLPLARSHMAVEPSHGGPALDAFVADPNDPDARVLPQVLEAEEVLHAADRSGAEPLGGGFDELGPEDFLDDLEAEPAQEHGAGPDSLEAALFAAARLAEGLNAHRIVSLDAGEDLRGRYRAALIRLAERLADHLAA